MSITATLQHRPTAPQQPVKLTTHELLKARYQFHMTLLKNYVRYAQEVENKSKLEITAEIEKIADQLIVQYKFGANFILEIGKFVQERYVQSGSKIYAQIQEESGLEEPVFERFMNEFKEQGQLRKVAESYSGRFRSVLNYR